ncbi:MAG: ATP-dependent DNA helicase RecG [Thermodesulfovibrionales bacterium]|nr:ATP-dependent DNA helicase RecG [Thermodesulfovibrionales bacterium]
MDCGLLSPIQYIKGVGPAKAKLLKRLGIETVRDVLFFLPQKYEFRPALCNISNIKYDTVQTVVGKVISTRLIETKKNPSLKIVEVDISDGSMWLKAKWFNQTYIKNMMTTGKQVLLTGIVKRDNYSLLPTIVNPDFEILDDVNDIDISVKEDCIIPIYSLTEGVTQRKIRSIVSFVFNNCQINIQDPIPDEILSRRGLPRLYDAIKAIHFPSTDMDLDALNSYQSNYHKRLIFDELFIIQLGLKALKNNLQSINGISMRGDGSLRGQLIKQLPFRLTSAQKRVISEIYRDMASTKTMNRLIQGDVGCGKTIVALLSMLNAVECGYQSALMAPTEILAEQHYANICSYLKGLDVKIIICTANRKNKLTYITRSEADIIVGTHAIIQENISFEALGLVVIDEQHRFGVLQRASLRKKGENPDCLVMTATPIPRTLALTVYGDLDYSVIDELPPNRRPVITRLFFEKNKNEIYDILKREIKSGRQAYVVYPLIEESENSDLRSAVEGAERLKTVFPEFEIGLVHGRMKAEQREKIMDDFKNGKVDILVSTTVIEVGVDVPNATVMLIVHAERFGLAQLHQLRGRVGRGEHESYCLLLCYGFSEEAKRRLIVMVKTSDGFKIAEEDMNIRGYGDFFGTRQSGMPNMRFANLFRDSKVLEIAQKEADELIKKDPMLNNYPHLKRFAQDFWGDKIEIFKTA